MRLGVDDAQAGMPEETRETSPEPVEPVEFDPEAGTYPSPILVSLACPTEGARIRYTLDGTEPDEGSPLYDPKAGLVLRESSTVRARAFVEGREPGAVSEAEYELRKPVWEEREPEDRADEVEHHVKDETQSGAWRLAGASSRGKLHAHRALWRDDAFAFGSAGGWTIIAVSDGAGSVPLSRVGARLACEEAVGYLEGRLAGFVLASENEEGLEESEMPRLRGYLAGAAEAALGAIRTKARERDLTPENLAATLLVVVCHPWRGQRLVGAIQVGDGTVALLGWDGNVTLLGEPDHGEHSSETRFLTTRGVEETFPRRARFYLKDRLRCIAAMSDGVSDDFFPEEKRLVELFLAEEVPGMTGRDGRPLRGVMDSVTRVPDPAGALLEWVRYEKRGSSDDRTLVLYWDAQ